MQNTLRVHPAIGVARVGNSEEFYLAPETMAGRPGHETADGLLLPAGGLPIKPGTEAETIRSGDLRDQFGALKRQAARFRIFAYPEQEREAWPTGQGTEVTIGTEIDGKTVADIVWSVHVANKKANTFVMVDDGDRAGIAGYGPGPLPPIRNADISGYAGSQPPDPLAVLNDPNRVRRLTIDPGPRTVSGRDAAAVHFDAATQAAYCEPGRGEVTPLPDYPKSFPGFLGMLSPAGPINTLGHLETDQVGRLIVVGGYGRASGWKINGQAPLTDSVNNDHWFDDTSDGPVTATVVFDDGSRIAAAGAWVTTTDPSFAPQILNVVSLWDDVYDVWVRELGLAPHVFDPAAGRFVEEYKPSFDDDIRPVFAATSLQQWVTNLNPTARSAHRQLLDITADTDPSSTPLSGLKVFRDPDRDETGEPDLMPLHLGDSNEAFLALRRTQYFFLRRWNDGRGNYQPGPGPLLGPGEYLDKAVMVNCLGGRFSPGIDLTFVVRQPDLYLRDWETSGAGPFRIRAKQLAYTALPPQQPLLTAGYVPLRADQDGLEPGDLSKWLAIPWHTDYNSCATHPPSPNPPGNRTLFWSWPAQRPVAVFTADDVVYRRGPEETEGPLSEQLGGQRWSVRGPGTDSPHAENWGRFQPPIRQMIDHWHQIGTVLQGPAIDVVGTPLERDWYLETQSQLEDTGLTPVVPFPNFASLVDPGACTDYPKAPTQLDERMIFFQMINDHQDPGALGDAREFVDSWLTYAEKFSLDPVSPIDQRYFDYTEQAFDDRLGLIYQDFADSADRYDPGGDPLFRTYEDTVTRIIQMAPFNLVDGAWLRNIGSTGPIDEVRALLYSVAMDESGDGDASRNHSNIYQDLCHSVGYYPPPIESRAFAFDPHLLQSAFTVPAFELAISAFSKHYYPELLGMTLQIEWEVLEIKPTRDLLDYFGINSHFFVMHIGIDNAVNGHGQRAADAIRLYLRDQATSGGQEAVQAAWRRIWNGFVAFGNVGTFADDLIKLIDDKPSLHDQMIAMIERKAEYGRLNHQTHTVGATPINEWFSRPEEFLEALRVHDWITPGDWAGSRINGLMSFQSGAMFRVFDEDEIALWAAYTESLAEPSTPLAPPQPDASKAMADLIEELRPVQQGVPGHDISMLADLQGTVHPMKWWFTQPARSLMQALSSPVNSVIMPGRPEESPYFTDLIAPTGPMGSVFDLPAASSEGKIRRAVVHDWIKQGCPLQPMALEERPPGVALHTSLWLTTPPAKVRLHPTGRIFGMGTVH